VLGTWRVDPPQLLKEVGDDPGRRTRIAPRESPFFFFLNRVAINSALHGIDRWRQDGGRRQSQPEREGRRFPFSRMTTSRARVTLRLAAAIHWADRFRLCRLVPLPTVTF
jgi:hypothetical protein